MTAAQVDTKEAYLKELGKAHEFSHEELAQNRLGRLHEAQVGRGSRSGVGGSVFAMLLGLMFAGGGVGGALYLHADLQQPVSDVDMNGLYALGGGGVLLGVLFVGGALLGFSKVARRRRAYASGLVLVADAPVHKVHVQGRGGAPSQWIYVIGRLRFQVSRRAWELVTHGAHYRVYHLEGDLLSLEPR